MPTVLPFCLSLNNKSFICLESRLLSDHIIFLFIYLPFIHLFFFFLNWFVFFFFFFYNFYFYFYLLFMAVLGLRFCVRAFSSCGKRGPLFIAVRRPLTIVACLVAEHRLQTHRLSNCSSRAHLL